MHKYFQLAKLTFQEYFAYRLNFILWRFRSMVLFLSLFFFWLAVYGQQDQLLGYQKSQMLTYVIGILFLRSLVTATRSADLAGQIRNGELTRVILWPIKMFSFWFSRDLVDKFLNLFLGIFEIGAILLIFKFPFYFPQYFSTFIYFFVLVGLAIFLYFYLSMFISITGFWSEEIWATRWLFGIVLMEFLAGAYFPIDILPNWLTRVIYLTPFPYLVFFPLKVWLEQLSLVVIFQAIVVCSFWLAIFYFLTRWLWQKGVKNYGAYGG
jgi:ABC-2 type transport system permease protein